MPHLGFSATCMTMRHLLPLSLPCLVLTLTYCASERQNHSAISRETLQYAAAQNLLDVRQSIPDVVCDLRYTTRENITRQVLYPAEMPCLLNAVTMEKLRIAQATLRTQGYGLKIWDAWRPPEVQLALFDHGGYTGMFTDPRIMWSRHCSGTAVDVTLVDLDGRELKMPTKHDAGGPQCHYLAIIKDDDVRQRRHALQMAMLTAGFSILDNEWWHFDDADFNNSPVPPVAFARDLGIPLPTVQGPRYRRPAPAWQPTNFTGSKANS
ncbi:MAG: M15 family metallopeptidase [Roseimicrobium sp.]